LKDFKIYVNESEIYAEAFRAPLHKLGAEKQDAESLRRPSKKQILPSFTRRKDDPEKKKIDLTQNGILGRFGNAEFKNLFGGDLNCFSGCGIPACTGCAIHLDQLTQPWNGKSFPGTFAGHINECVLSAFRLRFGDF